MKIINLLLILLLTVSISFCDGDDDPEPILQTHSIKLTVTGNCPVIKINDLYYYGLDHNVDYVEEYTLQSMQLVRYDIAKMTTDATSVTYELSINDTVVQTETTSSKDQKLIIRYLTQNNYNN